LHLPTYHPHPPTPNGPPPKVLHLLTLYDTHTAHHRMPLPPRPPFPPRAGQKDAPHLTIPLCTSCGQVREIQIAGRLKPDSKQISVEHGHCKGGGKDGKCKGSTITLTEKNGGGAVFHRVSYLHFQHLLSFQRDAFDEALVYPDELLNYMAYEGTGEEKKPRVEAEVFAFFKVRVEHHKSAYMKLDVGTHDTLTTRATTLA
jgi:hypothetical protein